MTAPAPLPPIMSQMKIVVFTQQASEIDEETGACDDDELDDENLDGEEEEEEDFDGEEEVSAAQLKQCALSSILRFAEMFP